MNKKLLAGLGVALMVTATAYAGPTLDAVKKKGFVQCGVSTGLPGFSAADDKGSFTGIDVDVCRAVAAAVFGDDPARPDPARLQAWLVAEDLHPRYAMGRLR